MLAPFNVMLVSNKDNADYLSTLLNKEDVRTFFVDNIYEAISYVHETDCIIFDDDTKHLDILSRLPNDEYSPYKIMLSSHQEFTKLHDILKKTEITKLLEQPVEDQSLIDAISEAKDFMGILRNNIRLSNRLIKKQDDLQKLREINETKDLQKYEELLKMRHKISQVQSELKTIQMLMLKTVKLTKKEHLEQITQIALLRHFDNLKIEISEQEQDAYSLPLISGGYILGKIYFKNIKPNQQEEEFLRKVSGIVSIAYDKIQRFSILEEKKKYWESFFDILPLPICFASTNGVIARANNAFANIFKQDVRLLIGKNFNDLFTYADNSMGDTTERIRQIHLNNLKYEVKETSYYDTDGTKYIVSIFRDITKEAKYKEQLQVSEKFSELGILSGSVAHEINNVVGGLSALLQILLQEEAETSLKDDLEEMYNASNRAKEIARSLLNFSRQTRQTDIQEIYVQELIQSMLQFAVLQIKHENITIETKLIDEPVFVDTYFNDLMQAILNVINVSIASIKESRDSLHTEGKIFLELLLNNDEAKIIISDNGNNPKTDNPGMFITKQILSNLGGYLDTKISKNNNIYTLVFKSKK